MDALQIIKNKLGVNLTPCNGSTSNEWYGACPFCEKGKLTGEDRFRVWVGAGKEGVGAFWCRQCGTRGFVDSLDDTDLTPEEKRLRRIEAEQEQARRERRELEKRMTALERMAQCTDHLEYHRTLSAEDRQWWYSQGILDPEIDFYQLGVCYGCPVHPSHPISMTIPVYDSHLERLLNIRHRLLGMDKDKYRPHMAGLPVTLFDSRLVHTEKELHVTEGEKKAIVLTANGFPSVGVFGTAGFNLSWLKHFSKVRQLWILPDPDAQDSWMKLGRQIAQEADWLDVRVATLPCKPDDFFIDEVGDADDFERVIKWAKKID